MNLSRVEKQEWLLPSTPSSATSWGNNKYIPTKKSADTLIGLEFEAGTTGPKGGDAGHGAATYLRFEYNEKLQNGGGAQFQVRTDEGKVEIQFYGDWEIDAVKKALRHMLTTLEEQTSTELRGVVTSWNPQQRVGTIALLEDKSQRFFMFGSRILSGPEPTLGSIVRFERSPKEQMPNRLPLADHIHVVEIGGNTAGAR
jgi:hypothetical protein